MKKLAIAGLLLASLGLSAGETAGGDGSFTKQELEEFLTGKTFPLREGGLYFKDRENMIAVWQEEIEETTWWATDESSFCYNLEMFGGEECLGLFRKGEDSLIWVWGDKKRQIKVSDVKEGRTF
jgi:hypothetical protein